MFNKFGTLVWILVLSGMSLTALSSAPAQAAQDRYFDNGIHATIYGPQEPPMAIATTSAGGGLVPFSVAFVEQALADMQGLPGPVDVRVYVLSEVPVAASGSFARDGAIYLAPGTGVVDESTIAYITTHEMGHVLTSVFMDGRTARWDAYLALRGLDRQTNGASAAHANRAREILAEDIRFLFGGSAANASRSIENHNLALPDRVLGLRALLVEFFASYGPAPTRVASTAFPNPFNPMTTIAMSLGSASRQDAEMAVLRIFDIRGALVRTVNGGRVENNRITVAWNGTTNAGTAAPSGRYLYLLKVGPLTADGNLTLVR